MAKCRIVISISVLLTALAVNYTNAECCFPFWIHHVCKGIPHEREMNQHFLGPLDGVVPGLNLFLNAIDENDYWIRDDSDRYKTKCISRFCHDGTPVESTYGDCGVGKCNIFGCNCDGGCRSKEGMTEEKIKDAFIQAFNFTRQATHKVLPF